MSIAANADPDIHLGDDRRDVETAAAVGHAWHEERRGGRDGGRVPAASRGRRGRMRFE